jgi:hypothetical protein
LESTRQVLAKRRMAGRIATRRMPAPIQANRRWVTERTHARGNQYGTLRWRTERRRLVVEFWLALASTVIACGRLLRRAWIHYRWEGRSRRRHDHLPAQPRCTSFRSCWVVGADAVRPPASLACHRESTASTGLVGAVDAAAAGRAGTSDGQPPRDRRWVLWRGAVLASRYPKMAARWERRGVVAVTTSTRSSAILDSKNRQLCKGFDMTAEPTTSGADSTRPPSTRPLPSPGPCWATGSSRACST